VLKLTIPGPELFNEKTNEFIKNEAVVLELEHSLVSLSKWESFWEKPFLGNDKKTPEQTLSYLQYMILSPEVSPEVFTRFTDEHIVQVNSYIEAKMTATWFREPPGRKSRNAEVITAELVYYWMISLNIPFECQYWHLNRLLTLIKVCSQKNSAGEKMSKSDLAARNRSLNAERRAKLGTKG